MRLPEFTRMLCAFAYTRYGLHFRDRDAFVRWQQRRVEKFLRTKLTTSELYQDYRREELAKLPIVDKSFTLKHFSTFNTHGISLDMALEAARASESKGALPPGFNPGLTAGLSSGTNGRPGVFLANASERAMWAGIMLARTLDRELLTLLATRQAPLRVAFFLRANSSLYTTLRSRRIDFRFFDLQEGAHTHISTLSNFAPDVLVAPASVLAWLAAEGRDTRLHIQPRKILSVAEVLEPDDEVRIRAAWSRPVHQLYQCTEGFLGYTCEHGKLHLNEEFVHVEPEWLDDAHTRFVPIITDFTRQTQFVVRYRLDDILRVEDAPCSCGRVTRTLAAIEGRLDDVLWLPDRQTGSPIPLFPDSVRRAVASCNAHVDDYTLMQHGQWLSLAVKGTETAYDSIRAALESLLARQGMQSPVVKHTVFDTRPSAAKRRRIICVTKPSSSPNLNRQSYRP